MLSMKSFCLIANACLLSLFLPESAAADATRDASRLIRLSNVRELFESTRQDQARSVIRTYASIVSTESGHRLPERIKKEIARCYDENYHWPNFEDGIVEILVENFTDKELKLLLGFYQNLSVSPTQIDAFRDIVAKGELIQSLSAEYIFNSTQGCIELGTEAVLAYLRAQP